MAQVERLTASPAFSTFSVAVQPIVNVHGTLGGKPLTADFQPALTFQVADGQLQPTGGSAGASSSSTTSAANYTPKEAGSLGQAGVAPATITVLGVSPEISLLRRIAVVGLLLSIGAAVYFYLRKRSEPFVESARIQSQYGDMIVPIVAGEDLGWPPVDVPDIKALVKLAESGQRLILHNRSNNVDTYMLNEEGTVYRYQVKPSNVVWGDWSETTTPAQTAA
jgi:hypothetical protein